MCGKNSRKLTASCWWTRMLLVSRQQTVLQFPIVILFEQVFIVMQVIHPWAISLVLMQFLSNFCSHNNTLLSYLFPWFLDFLAFVYADMTMTKTSSLMGNCSTVHSLLTTNFKQRTVNFCKVQSLFIISSKQSTLNNFFLTI